jgi:hypothetical protein
MRQLTAKKNRGTFKDQLLYPHLHKDGMYVATKSKYEVDYIRVSNIDELAALVGAGYGARMSNPEIPQAPSFIAHNSIDFQNNKAPLNALKVFLARFADGEQLDKATVTSARKEQAFLRSYLLKGQTSGECELCHRLLPEELLVAAHIKPRSKCEHHERLDFDNVAVLMCSLGCDTLFEKGYVYVHSGTVRRNPRRTTTAHLTDAIHQIDGQHVASWSASSVYYSWHANAYGHVCE